MEDEYYCDGLSRNKRFRVQQEESTFHLPPSPLKRAVQGPHRRTDFQKTRVSTLSDLDKQLEQECIMEERCYDTSILKSLESYKKRIAALQAKFAYTNGNHHGVDRAGVAIQEEDVAIDSDRGGLTIDDERVEGATYSGRIETNGRGIVIDNGRASVNPVDVADVETNSDRESEKEKFKPRKEGGLLWKGVHGKVAERDFESDTNTLKALKDLHFNEAKSKERKLLYKQMHEKFLTDRNSKFKPREEGGLLCKGVHGKVAEIDFESVTSKLKALKDLHFNEAKSKERKLLYRQMHEKFLTDGNSKLKLLDLKIALAATELETIQSTLH